MTPLRKSPITVSVGTDKKSLVFYPLKLQCKIHPAPNVGICKKSLHYYPWNSHFFSGERDFMGSNYRLFSHTPTKKEKVPSTKLFHGYKSEEILYTPFGLPKSRKTVTRCVTGTSYGILRSRKLPYQASSSYYMSTKYAEAATQTLVRWQPLCLISYCIIL